MKYPFFKIVNVHCYWLTVIPSLLGWLWRQDTNDSMGKGDWLDVCSRRSAYSCFTSPSYCVKL